MVQSQFIYLFQTGAAAVSRLQSSSDSVGPFCGAK